MPVRILLLLNILSHILELLHANLESHAIKSVILFLLHCILLKLTQQSIFSVMADCRREKLLMKVNEHQFNLELWFDKTTQKLVIV